MITRRSVSLATLALVGVNLIAYILEIGVGGMATCRRLGFVPEDLLRNGDILGLLVYPLLHDPFNVAHLAGNVVLLALFAPLVERQLGPTRVFAVYVAGGIAGALGHALVAPQTTDPLVGSSGCVFAILAVTAVVEPRTLGFTVLMFTANLVALFHPSPWLVPATTSIGCHIGGFTAGAAVVSLARASNVGWAESRQLS